MIDTDPFVDSLTDLLVGIDEDGYPPLAWVVRWSDGGRDPVHAAWEAAESPHAMVKVVRLGWGDRAIPLKATMVATFQAVSDGVTEVLPPGGWPAKSPPQPPRKVRQRRQMTGAEFVRGAQRYLSSTASTAALFPPPLPGAAADITWSLPGIAGRSSHGPTRLRYMDSAGEKWFERVHRDYQDARERLQYRVAVAKIRRECPVPPTLEELLRRASTVLT